MALMKLTISTKGGEKIEAQFNPSELEIERSVCWVGKSVAETDVPQQRFTHGNASELPIRLFFDTYEKRTDVRREYTDRVVALTRIEGHGDRHEPPVCTLSWGEFGDIFTGVLVKVTQKFTLFLEDGTPVRATVDCRFKESRSPEVDAKLTDPQSADIAKVHIVRRGDTLSGIAAVQYEDPALWRPIARFNRIDDPLGLKPGTKLLIPPLTAEGVERY